MGVIGIRFSDKDEVKIKKMALAEGKTISQFCRDRIAQDNQEPELCRVTIESEIDELKKEISLMNKNILDLSKGLLLQSRINSNLSTAFLHLAIDDPEQKYEIYNEAKKEAEEYIEKLFEEEK